MSDDADLTFQNTLDWATSEDQRRETSSKNIPISYLIIGAFIIFVLVILMIYLMGRNPSDEIDALEMMKDEKYVFDEGEYDDTYEDNSLNYSGSYEPLDGANDPGDTNNQPI